MLCIHVIIHTLIEVSAVDQCSMYCACIWLYTYIVYRHVCRHVYTTWYYTHHVHTYDCCSNNAWMLIFNLPNRETRKKTVLDGYSNDSLLTYNQIRVFDFSGETSGEELRENDTICTINLPLVVSTYTITVGKIISIAGLLAMKSVT